MKARQAPRALGGRVRLTLILDNLPADIDTGEKLILAITQE